MTRLAPENRRASIDLDTVRERADLQSRIDRKYVVERDVANQLVTDLPDRVAVLTIDGRTNFDYSSTYFDTPEFDSYRSAAFGRRRRFKVRTRQYLNSGLCMLEVKVKGGRGETIKHRRPADARSTVTLNAAQIRWVGQFLDDPTLVSALGPVLETRYTRRTLVDRSDWSRCTIDSDLRFHHLSGRTADLRSFVVVETKSTGSVGAADRWLRRHGHRPTRISKYCSANAVLDPELPSNRWALTVRRHFRAIEDVDRQRSGGGPT